MAHFDSANLQFAWAFLSRARSGRYVFQRRVGVVKIERMFVVYTEEEKVFLVFAQKFCFSLFKFHTRKVIERRSKYFGDAIRFSWADTAEHLPRTSHGKFWIPQQFVNITSHREFSGKLRHSHLLSRVLEFIRRKWKRTNTAETWGGVNYNWKRLVRAWENLFVVGFSGLFVALLFLAKFEWNLKTFLGLFCNSTKLISVAGVIFTLLIRQNIAFYMLHREKLSLSLRSKPIKLSSVKLCRPCPELSCCLLPSFTLRLTEKKSL